MKFLSIFVFAILIVSLGCTTDKRSQESTNLISNNDSIKVLELIDQKIGV